MIITPAPLSTVKASGPPRHLVAVVVFRTSVGGVGHNRIDSAHRTEETAARQRCPDPLSHIGFGPRGGWRAGRPREAAMLTASMANSHCGTCPTEYTAR